MIDVLIGALIPIIITLLLGFFAGWHNDFDAKQASTLNRMVMLYAMPLTLFSGVLSISREVFLSQGPLAIILMGGIVLSYLVSYIISHFIFKRPANIAALQALVIASPSTQVIGTALLGKVLGSYSAVPIALSSITMNLFLVPVTLLLLSRKPVDGTDTSVQKISFAQQVVSTFKEPIVWAPIIAFILMLIDVDIPSDTRTSLLLLGNTTAGVSLFACGIIVYSRRLTFNLAIGASVLARNIIVPLLVVLCVKIFVIGVEESQAAIITMAMPTATTAMILAVQYKTAEQEMGSVLFFSMLFSLLSISGIIYFFV